MSASEVTTVFHILSTKNIFKLTHHWSLIKETLNKKHNIELKHFSSP
jgi:hypothetical protein